MKYAVKGSDEVNPPQFRVNDDVTFSVQIFEHTLSGKKPYQADDVQVRPSSRTQQRAAGRAVA